MCLISITDCRCWILHPMFLFLHPIRLLLVWPLNRLVNKASFCTIEDFHLDALPILHRRRFAAPPEKQLTFLTSFHVIRSTLTVSPSFSFYAPLSVIFYTKDFPDALPWPSSDQTEKRDIWRSSVLSFGRGPSRLFSVCCRFCSLLLCHFMQDSVPEFHRCSKKLHCSKAAERSLSERRGPCCYLKLWFDQQETGVQVLTPAALASPYLTIYIYTPYYWKNIIITRLLCKK